MMKKRLLLGWSGGKDSSLALHELKQQPDVEVAALLTTVTEGYDRISMHGVRRKLLIEQAEALGFPLEEIFIPQQCSNEIYEERMRQTLEKFHRQGISAAAFGDLFLQEVRSYREDRMAKMGMTAVFPIWGKNTSDLARQFIKLGFRAMIACVDTKALSQEFAGRNYDLEFINDLPAGIDPCGENGEFHTFVYDGPIFTRPVKVQTGEKLLRDNRFFYCDLVSPD
jgi:uncharacterized protein (TIGR00290 family)